MEMTYKTKGVCAREIYIKVNDEGIIEDVKFNGGCNGNTQGVAKLCIGRNKDEVIQCIEGIRCRNKPTSCPDQLAKALKEIE